MIRDTISTKQRIVIGIFAVLLMLVGYNYLSYRQHQIEPKDTTIPTMTQFQEGIKQFTAVDIHGERWITKDARTTIKRLFAGLSLSLFFGFGLGILIGCKARWYAFFYPIIAFASSIAPTAAIAIFFVMVGTGFEMYVAMIIFGVMPILTQNVCDEVKNFPIELLNKARSWGATEMELVWNIIIPHILPRAIMSFCLQIGPAIVYLIPAEMLVGHDGFGYRIRLASKLQNMNIVYPYLIMLALFLIGFRNSLTELVKILFPWYSDSDSHILNFIKWLKSFYNKLKIN